MPWWADAANLFKPKNGKIEGVTLLPAAIPRNRVTFDVPESEPEITIRDGLAPMTSNKNHLDTVAHEIRYGHTYLDKISSPEQILFRQYPNFGYRSAPSEVAAGKFADRVI